MRKATCHPDKPERSRGLCFGCYSTQRYREKHSVESREVISLSRSADCHPERPHYAKGKCASCYERDRARLNPKRKEYCRRRSSIYYHSHRDQVRLSEVARKFHLSPEEYQAMVERQKGLCAICGKPAKFRAYLCVDHCHSKDKARELLCITCNAGLGQFYDDPDLLDKAAAYLRKHGG